MLDLSNNNLDEPEVLDILSRIPNLRVLNIMGNPVVRKTKEYRRTMIHKCLSLTYLDSRPVQPIDRACIAAWAAGGLDAERRERERWIREEQQR